MSLVQLLEQYDEVDLMHSLNNAKNIQSRAEWLDLDDDLKYKAYISVYYSFNKEKEDASFNNFINMIHTKLVRISNDNEYSEVCPNVSVHSVLNLNDIVHQVEIGEKTWLQGLKDLFTLEDMEIYGF
jgi:hypothetical protein